MTQIFDALVPRSLTDFRELAGRELGPTSWWDVSQDTVTAFADVTQDHQWIHVDPDRARGSAFGGTVAHGLLTLSMGPWFTEQLVSFGGFAHSLNYGYNKVRFPAPTPVGSRVRMRLTVADVQSTKESSALVTFGLEFEAEHVTKPVCVADFLVWFTEHPAE